MDACGVIHQDVFLRAMMPLEASSHSNVSITLAHSSTNSKSQKIEVRPPRRLAFFAICTLQATEPAGFTVDETDGRRLGFPCTPGSGSNLPFDLCSKSDPVDMERDPSIDIGDL